MTGVVIIGAGLAGARCAERLRSGGYQGRIRVIGEEPVPPYRRPALSKELLTGAVGLGDLRLRSPAWWAEAEIELVIGRRVVWIDAKRRRALLQGGSELDWETLVVATGSRARTIPGLEPARGLHSLRSFQDALGLRAVLRPGRRVVVIGAGFIGTEVASTASALGVEIVLVDPALPLVRVLGDEVAGLLANRYREHGIDLRTGTALERLDVDEGRVSGVHLTDGAHLDCDAVLVAIGAEPAVPPGLPSAPEGGIATDAAGRTSFEDVYACGDVARSMHPLLGRHVRVEHWADAAAQGTAVAEAVLGIEPASRELPLFWSDQFGLRLQYVGHALEWSSVELDGDHDEFRAVYLDGEGRPLAALVANRPRELGRLRRELADALPRAA
jgi:3-phenylpropionate/trans-cinnamate dioxygenase ferredoxin reductase subunit